MKYPCDDNIRQTKQLQPQNGCHSSKSLKINLIHTHNTEKQTIRKDFYDNIFRISRKHSGKFSYIVPQINKSKNFTRCNFQQIRFSGNGIPYPFIFYS